MSGEKIATTNSSEGEHSKEINSLKNSSIFAARIPDRRTSEPSNRPSLFSLGDLLARSHESFPIPIILQTPDQIKTYHSSELSDKVSEIRLPCSKDVYDVITQHDADKLKSFFSENSPYLDFLDLQMFEFFVSHWKIADTEEETEEEKKEEREIVTLFLKRGVNALFDGNLFSSIVKWERTNCLFAVLKFYEYSYQRIQFIKVLQIYLRKSKLSDSVKKILKFFLCRFKETQYFDEFYELLNEYFKKQIDGKKDTYREKILSLTTDDLQREIAEELVKKLNGPLNSLLQNERFKELQDLAEQLGPAYENAAQCFVDDLSSILDQESNAKAVFLKAVKSYEHYDNQEPFKVDFSSVKLAPIVLFDILNMLKSLHDKLKEAEMTAYVPLNPVPFVSSPAVIQPISSSLKECLCSKVGKKKESLCKELNENEESLKLLQENINKEHQELQSLQQIIKEKEYCLNASYSQSEQKSQILREKENIPPLTWFETIILENTFGLGTLLSYLGLVSAIFKLEIVDKSKELENIKTIQDEQRKLNIQQDKLTEEIKLYKENIIQMGDKIKKLTSDYEEKQKNINSLKDKMDKADLERLTSELPHDDRLKTENSLSSSLPYKRCHSLLSRPPYTIEDIIAHRSKSAPELPEVKEIVSNKTSPTENKQEQNLSVTSENINSENLEKQKQKPFSSKRSGYQFFTPQPASIILQTELEKSVFSPRAGL